MPIKFFISPTAHRCVPLPEIRDITYRCAMKESSTNSISRWRHYADAAMTCRPYLPATAAATGLRAISPAFTMMMPRQRATIADAIRCITLLPSLRFPRQRRDKQHATTFREACATQMPLMPTWLRHIPRCFTSAVFSPFTIRC